MELAGKNWLSNLFEIAKLIIALIPGENSGFVSSQCVERIVG